MKKKTTPARVRADIEKNLKQIKDITKTIEKQLSFFSQRQYIYGYVKTRRKQKK